MSHRATASFWAAYNDLPSDLRRQADEAYALLKRDPRHPSLQLKKVGRVWSARITQDYRAIALSDKEGFTWIWIGTHAAYDRLIRS